jgi:hypothetical protein
MYAFVTLALMEVSGQLHTPTAVPTVAIRYADTVTNK